MNLDSENLGIPETEFSSVCTMPSTEFNRICREFGGLSETIKIETNKESGKTVIDGSDSVTITADQLKSISEKIAEVRTKYTS